MGRHCCRVGALEGTQTFELCKFFWKKNGDAAEQILVLVQNYQKLKKILFFSPKLPKTPQKKSQKEKIIFGTFLVIFDLKKKSACFYLYLPTSGNE